MRPIIDDTEFGSITIDKKVYDFDVFIKLNDQIEKRKKKLSKAVYGTSHIISLNEAEHVYEDGAEYLIIGAGQYGLVNLSKEANDYLAGNLCQIIVLPTPEAIKAWNIAEGKKAIGLFHVTC